MRIKRNKLKKGRWGSLRGWFRRKKRKECEVLQKWWARRWKREGRAMVYRHQRKCSSTSVCYPRYHLLSHPPPIAWRNSRVRVCNSEPFVPYRLHCDANSDCWFWSKLEHNIMAEEQTNRSRGKCFCNRASGCRVRCREWKETVAIGNERRGGKGRRGIVGFELRTTPNTPLIEPTLSSSFVIPFNVFYRLRIVIVFPFRSRTVEEIGAYSHIYQ